MTERSKNPQDRGGPKRKCWRCERIFARPLSGDSSDKTCQDCINDQSSRRENWIYGRTTGNK